MEHTDPPDDYDDHCRHRDYPFVENKPLPYFLTFLAVYNTITTFYLFFYTVSLSLYEKITSRFFHLFRGPPCFDAL